MDISERHTAIHRAIRTSCFPLLCGSSGSVYPIARMLFRRYGIVSYAILSERGRRRHLFSRILAAPTVRIIRNAPLSPSLTADAAISFFSSLSETALPVLIDCTREHSLSRDPDIRDRLEPHCFLTDDTQPEQIPPFCFLKEAQP